MTGIVVEDKYTVLRWTCDGVVTGGGAVEPVKGDALSVIKWTIEVIRSDKHNQNQSRLTRVRLRALG